MNQIQPSSVVDGVGGEERERTYIRPLGVCTCMLVLFDCFLIKRYQESPNMLKHAQERQVMNTYHVRAPDAANP